MLFSGVASTGARGGAEYPLTVKNLPKIRKNQQKEGENQEKVENWEEKTKIAKVLSLFPS